ncbi:hypothetical protein PLESTB_000225300 [Pleodorina starrii]|uniref:Uncharacterized protein n=1 Tax=Pleodorina starrii TaxID=330485 RepID=A0A9W6BCY5_9CHLO|nr:hypothetical protein PLESTM_002055300 [Pleodorina starrii]GLC49495.1 hypothetical protein PLESTB_000225300 [Pleodorina starrii]GLC70404.1 hypothetical protein PLESTF_000969800 [Pleodorina starrii]
MVMPFPNDASLESVVTQWQPWDLCFPFELEPLPWSFRDARHWAECHLPYVLEEQRAHLWFEVGKHFAVGFGGLGGGLRWTPLVRPSVQWGAPAPPPPPPPSSSSEGGGDSSSSAAWWGPQWCCSLVRFDLAPQPGPVWAQPVRRLNDVVLLTNDPGGERPHEVQMALGVVRAMPPSHGGDDGGDGSEQPVAGAAAAAGRGYEIAVFAPKGSPLARALGKTLRRPGEWAIAYAGSLAPYIPMYDTLQAWRRPGAPEVPPLLQLLIDQPTATVATANAKSGSRRALPYTASQGADGEDDPGPDVVSGRHTRYALQALASAVQSYCEDTLQLSGHEAVLQVALSYVDLGLGLLEGPDVLPPRGTTLAPGKEVRGGTAPTAEEAAAAAAAAPAAGVDDGAAAAPLDSQLAAATAVADEGEGEGEEREDGTVGAVGAPAVIGNGGDGGVADGGGADSDIGVADGGASPSAAACGSACEVASLASVSSDSSCNDSGSDDSGSESGTGPGSPPPGPEPQELSPPLPDREPVRELQGPEPFSEAAPAPAPVATCARNRIRLSLPVPIPLPPPAPASIISTAAEVVLLQGPPSSRRGPQHHLHSGSGNSSGKSAASVGGGARMTAVVGSGLVSVLAALSPAGRAVLVCAHPNDRVAQLAASFLPQLQRPELQFAGSGAMQREGLRAGGPLLRTGDCVALHSGGFTCGELNLQSRVNQRLFAALHGPDGWYGTLQQLLRLQNASEAQLRKWSGEGGEGTPPSRQGQQAGGQGAAAHTTTITTTTTTTTSGAARAGGYLQARLRLLLCRLRRQAETLLADLPSAAWVPEAEVEAIESEQEAADDVSLAAAFRVGSERGRALLEELLRAAAAVESELASTSSEQLQAALLPGLRKVPARARAGVADSSAAAAGSGCGGGAGNDRVCLLVVALCELLAAVCSCRGLPSLRLGMGGLVGGRRQQAQEASAPTHVQQLETIWGRDGWIRTVSELRRLVQLPTRDCLRSWDPESQSTREEAASDLHQQQQQPAAVAAETTATTAAAGGSSCRGGDEALGGGATSTSISAGLLTQLTRLSELVPALKLAVQPGAGVAAAVAAAAGASAETAPTKSPPPASPPPSSPKEKEKEEEEGSLESLLSRLSEACDDAANFLPLLDEVAVWRALWQQQLQEARQQVRLPPRQQPLLIRALLETAPGGAEVAAAAAAAGASGDVGGGDGDGGGGDCYNDLLAEMFRSQLGRVMGLLERLDEEQPDVRGCVSREALSRYCLRSARVVFSTVSGLTRREVREAAVAVGSCILEGANQVLTSELAAALGMQPPPPPPPPQPSAAAADAAAGGGDDRAEVGAEVGGKLAAVPTTPWPRLLVLAADPLVEADGRPRMQPRVLSELARRSSYRLNVFEGLQQRGWSTLTL